MTNKLICPSCVTKSENLPRGLNCETCGYQPHPIRASSEPLQLLELHAQIAQSQDEDEKAALLENGYLPDGTENLIEAGLYCMPLIDSNNSQAVSQASAGRLRAIVTKLHITAEKSDPSYKTAVAEFEQFLDDVATQNRKDDRVYGSVALILITLIILFACWAILQVTLSTP